MACDRRQIIKDIAACPDCHSALLWTNEDATCVHCRAEFFSKNEIPNFSGYDRDKEATQSFLFQSEQMFNNTLTAKLYNFGKKIISSEYMPKDHVKEFIRRAAEGTVIVELGSGNRRLREDVINIDLFPFPNVDLTANIMKTPLRDHSVDFVVLDTVLEHVPEPERVVKELFRILKPAGKAICIAPFIFPYHGYPKHYFNYSKDGLEFLFKNFTECKVEMNTGPGSGFVNLLSEYFAVAMAGENNFLYTFFKGLGLLPIFFLKYLDQFWNASGRVTRISSILSAFLTK